MIKANELRIGNSAKLFLGVGDSGPEYREVVITGLKTDRDQRIRIDSSDYWHPVENFEPIPLTEELLLKFGFELQGINRYWLEPIILIFYVEGAVYLANQRHVNIHYVHQLQNLYFALTGTELELKQTP